MKICVLGAGVIGVTTAYALARLGHDVSVIDKGSEVASGASHANGAQLSYSYIAPFASPSTLKKLPGYLVGLDPAIRLGLSLKSDYLAWGMKFLSQCRSSKYAENYRERAELAALSQETLSIYENEILPTKMVRTGSGKIVILQSKGELKAAAENSKDQTVLTPTECFEMEPALKSWTGKVFGGVYSNDDSALDPIRYCKALENASVKQFGVKYYFNEKIVRIHIDAGSAKSIETESNVHNCDAVVVCLGNETEPLLKPLGLKVPIYPMQGYSLTLPARKTSPKVSITDLKNKTVYANLGNSIRIAGFMDANQSAKKSIVRSKQLLELAKEKWPDAADYEGNANHWTHFRPMVPSGVPIIGKTKIDGLYLNIGHGSLGYTFAAGSANRIAAAIGHVHANIKAKQTEKTYA